MAIQAAPTAGPARQLQLAGRVLVRAGLVTAFGHVSVRLDDGHLLITPAVPLDRVDPHACVIQPIASAALCPGAPREAWLHMAVMAARPDVRAVCRAQPETVTALAAVGVAVPAITGHAVLAGAPVPIAADARLVRDRGAAERAAVALGRHDAVALTGNGAVTTGESVGAAVARMWLLERAARSTATAYAIGVPEPIDDSARRSWRETAPELLRRVWEHLEAQEDS